MAGTGSNGSRIAKKIVKTVKKVAVDPTSMFSKSTTKPKVSSSRPTMKPVPKANKQMMPKTSKQPKTVKSPMPKKLTGEAAAKAYRQEISPKGMASASAAQKKAMDKKYPGLYKSSTPKPKKK